MVRFDPRLVQYDAARTQQFYELLTERVRETPGVRERGPHAEPAARAGRLRRSSPSCRTASRCRATARASPSTMDTVDEGYFETMGIPILRGRGFRASDTADAPRVAVVNEQFAKHYWPGADAVGKRIRLDEPHRHAGRDRRRRADDQVPGHGREADRTSCTCRSPSIPSPRMVLLVRSSGDPLQLVEPGEGGRPVARSEHADAGDEDLRGPVPVSRGGRAARRDRAGRHHGRGGPPAGDRRPVRAGGVQREPQDPRDRHPHGDRRAGRPTCCAW